MLLPHFLELSHTPSRAEHVFIIRSLVDVCLGWFYFLDLLNGASTNKGVPAKETMERAHGAQENIYCYTLHMASINFYIELQKRNTERETVNQQTG